MLRPDLTRRPVHSIAARWGFSSAAVFSRAFRQAYGTSPTELRRRPRGGGGGAPSPGSA
ncbi:helix-turn-helix domain-containing protein, partial [Streptomyces sp. NPDC127112]|uniref:helix-turn-helix domain-containing protein n=1 Tax=Streptomyces sp. NPDC127112 TaxID=3345364 RepID=UPI003644C2E5